MRSESVLDLPLHTNFSISLPVNCRRQAMGVQPREGVASGSLVESGAVKLNGRVSYFLREAGREICQDGFLKGQRERARR